MQTPEQFFPRWHEKALPPLVGVIFLLAAGDVRADGFRCGAKIIKNGDSVSRLVRACGKPDRKYYAYELVGIGGTGLFQQLHVVNYVYEGGDRRATRVVSLLQDEVVKVRAE